MVSSSDIDDSEGTSDVSMFCFGRVGVRYTLVCLEGSWIDGFSRERAEEGAVKVLARFLVCLGVGTLF
jgi:hypothetical protein